MRAEDETKETQETEGHLTNLASQPGVGAEGRDSEQPGEDVGMAVLFMEKPYFAPGTDDQGLQRALQSQAMDLAARLDLPLLSMADVERDQAELDAQRDLHRDKAAPAIALKDARIVELNGLAPVVYSDAARATRGSGLWRRSRSRAVCLCQWQKLDNQN